MGMAFNMNPPDVHGVVRGGGVHHLGRDLLEGVHVGEVVGHLAGQDAGGARAAIGSRWSAQWRR